MSDFLPPRGGHPFLHHPFYAQTPPMRVISTVLGDATPAEADRADAARMPPPIPAIDKAQEIGGLPLRKKVVEVAQQHGDDVAEALVIALDAPIARALYMLRKKTAEKAHATKAPADVATARTIALQVQALELQAFASIMEEKTQRTAELRRTSGRGDAIAPAGPVALPSAIGMREIPGKGGYVYRQFADGTIAIVKSPRGGGTRVVPKGTAAHTAILREIGSFPPKHMVTTESISRILAAIEQVTPLLDSMPGGGGSVAADALRVGASALTAAAPAVAVATGAMTAGAAGATGASVTAVSSLLTAAGASSLVPVAGWIVAAGLAVSAGIISLVSTIKRRRGGMTKAQGIEVARQLRIPHAEELPGFVLSALNMQPAQRQKLATKIQGILQRRKRFLAKGREPKLRLKLAILGTVEALRMAEARQQHATPTQQPLGGYTTGGGRTSPPFVWMG